MKFARQPSLRSSSSPSCPPSLPKPSPALCRRTKLPCSARRPQPNPTQPSLALARLSQGATAPPLPAATALKGPRAVLLGRGRRPRPTCRGGPGLVFPARPRPGGRGPEEDPGQSSPAAAAVQAGGGARPKGNGCPEGKGSLAVPCRPSMPRSPGVHCRSTGLSAILRGISRCPSRPIGRQRKCVSLVAVEGANAARSRPKGGGPSQLVPPWPPGPRTSPLSHRPTMEVPGTAALLGRAQRRTWHGTTRL